MSDASRPMIVKVEPISQRTATVAGVTFRPLRGVTIREIAEAVEMEEWRREGVFRGLEAALLVREAFRLIAPSRNRCRL